MKKKVAAILTVLVLLLGLGITAKTVFSFNAENYLEQVSEKISEAKSVTVNVGLKMTGRVKTQAVDYQAFGEVNWPKSYKVDVKLTSTSETVTASEIGIGELVYRKDPLTEGKWAVLDETDKDGFGKSRVNVEYAKVKDIIEAVETVESSDLQSGVRTLRAKLDWSKYIASMKSSGKADWIAEQIPKADDAELVLKVDDGSRLVTRSELKVSGGGTTLEYNADYYNWDKKYGISAPAEQDKLQKDVQERMLKARKRFDDGLTAYKADDLGAAVDNFAMAVTYQPKNYNYNVWVAKANLRKLNYTEAEAYAQRAMDLDKNKADAYMVASKVFAVEDKGDPRRRTQAIDYAKQAVKLAPNSSEAYTTLGYAYFLKTLPTFEDSASLPADYKDLVKDETPKAKAGFYSTRAMVALDKAIELDSNAVEPLLTKSLLLTAEPQLISSIKKFWETAGEYKTGGADIGAVISDYALARDHIRDNIERAGELMEKATKINGTYVDKNIEPHAEGLASVSKMKEMAEKLAALRAAEEKVYYQYGRWKELKGKNATDAWDAWVKSAKDYLEICSKIENQPVPQSYTTYINSVGELLKAAHDLL